MRASGFDQPGGGCVFGLCFPVTQYPRSDTGLSRSRGFPFALQIDRRLSNHRWGLSVLVGRTMLGETDGQHAPLTTMTTTTYLTIDYGVDNVGFMATLERRGFAVGAGPALYIARVRDGDRLRGAPQAWEHHPKLGALAQGRMMLPARSRLFLDASGQYRYVGTVDVGPIRPRTDFDPGATFPRSRASFSHWLVALGGGVRF